MARIAAAAFDGIANASMYPLEPILSGVGGKAEWQAAMLNINHVYRFMNPVVVRQDELSATNQYLPGTALAYEMAQAWRIPVYAGGSGQTLGGAVWAKCQGAAESGKVQIASVGAASSQAVSFAGTTATRQTFTGVALNTAAAYETITLELLVDQVGDEIRVINVDFWLEDSGTPLAAGEDGNGYYPLDDADGKDDAPLPVHRVRRMALNMDKIAERPGVVMAWADDFRNLRSGIKAENAVRSIERIPVRYGPKATSLRVYANGYCDDTATRLRVWTAQGTHAGALELTLPANAVWTGSPFTAWVTGTVSLNPAAGIGTTELFAEIEGSVGNEADLFGFCAWEE